MLCELLQQELGALAPLQQEPAGSLGDGSMARWLDGSMARWLDGSMARWLDGSMARWLDGSMARWLDGSRGRGGGGAGGTGGRGGGGVGWFDFWFCPLRPRADQEELARMEDPQ